MKPAARPVRVAAGSIAADCDGGNERIELPSSASKPVLRTTARAVAQLGSAEVHVVSPTGELDLYSAPALDAELSALLEAPGSRIILDLSGVTFMDSTTLGLLLKTVKRLRATGGELVLVCGDARVTRVIEVTGLLPMFRIERSIAAAVRTLGASSPLRSVAGGAGSSRAPDPVPAA